MPRKIYAASSWRNDIYPQLTNFLREEGHEVYDFRQPQFRYSNPFPNAHGFHWSDIDTNWAEWSIQKYIENLNHPEAVQGSLSDKTALDWCDTCVLVLPSGASAHLEVGYVKGQGKDLFIYTESLKEPELIYKMADKIVRYFLELGAALQQPCPVSTL